MVKILLFLRDLFTDYFMKQTPKLFQYVDVLSEYETATLLSLEDIPALLIMPIGENHISGPMGNMGTRLLDIKIRLVFQSSELNKDRLDVSQFGIDHAIELVRKLLWGDKMMIGEQPALSKKQSGIIWGTLPQFSVQYLDVVSTLEGVFTACDIIVQFKTMTEWTGPHNSQENTNISSGFIHI